MAMVVMVIVRSVFWIRVLINAYVTITKARRLGQVGALRRRHDLGTFAATVRVRTSLRGVLPLPNLISSAIFLHLYHNLPWPPSLSRRASRIKISYRSADRSGAVVKAAVITFFLIIFVAPGAHAVPADNVIKRPADAQILILNAQQMQLLRSHAQAGEAEAQYILGAAYRTGGPILAKDTATAAQWWRKAALQGHSKAQNGLGYMYQNGVGVAQDYAEAARWYRRAAEQGDAAAQNNLGNLYFAGRGVRRNYGAAFSWVSKAATQGLAIAEHGVALMYRYGKGTARNLAQALTLYQEAAHKGLPQAQNELGAMYLRGEGVARNPAEAFRWFHLAAEKSLPDAENNLGYLYSTGQGTTRNYSEAFHWFNLAAQQGLAAAELNLGAMYMSGRGVPLDYVQGYMWLTLAAAQGSKSASAGRKSLKTIMTPEQLSAAEERTAEWRQEHSSESAAEAGP